jgi:hypothetical protein
MRTTERHARNDRIVQLRARGHTLRQIAEEVGVSERHCARVLNERREHRRSESPAAPRRASYSDATVVQLLDKVQEATADLAAEARGQAGRYGLLANLRIESALGEAEHAIAELRGRTEEFSPAGGASATTAGEGGAPLRETDMS